jgi:DNA-binding transcriptional MerR regulator
MKVSELAQAAGVTAETVRHYVREGLLAAERDPDNGYRVFHAEALARLQFLRRARALGFSIPEIRVILGDAQRGASPCPHVRQFAQAHLEELDVRIEELTARRRRLSALIETWSGLPDGVPNGDQLCPLIEAAAGPEDDA